MHVVGHATGQVTGETRDAVRRVCAHAPTPAARDLATVQADELDALVFRAASAWRRTSATSRWRARLRGARRGRSPRQGAAPGGQADRLRLHQRPGGYHLFRDVGIPGVL
ncbi:MAG: hypothetical protein R3F43_13180 [bacterium]